MINVHIHLTSAAEALALIDSLATKGIPLHATSGLSGAIAVAPTRGASLPKEKHPLELEYNRIFEKQFRLTAAHCQAVGWKGGRRECPARLRLEAIAGDLQALAEATPGIISPERVAELCAVSTEGFTNEEGAEESADAGEIAGEEKTFEADISF